MNVREREHAPFNHSDIPPTLSSRRAAAFWLAVLLTGLGAGIAVGMLTSLLQSVEHLFWRGPNILDAAALSDYPRHVWVLLGAGVLTGLGQLALQHLSSANGIDIQKRSRVSREVCPLCAPSEALCYQSLSWAWVHRSAEGAHLSRLEQ